jgi:acetoin utilization deacetylase AcuC-like enzyme
VRRSRAGYGTQNRAMALYLSHESSHRHDTGPHPENAGRLVAVEAALERAGWAGLERVEAPAATREQLERVHDARHVTAIEELCAGGGGMIDLDTVASADSYEAALHAAGGAADAAERLLAREAGGAICGLRPPGHHAERARAMGFCLFNNVAVAARHAIDACGARRVLILDWDVHHGNGTEAIFAAASDVLYASIHQWPLYPGTGAAEFEGKGEGQGFTVNLPVSPGTGSEEFLGLVQHVIVPIARAYEPGLIAISAGYDAHRDDPLASCAVDTDAYAAMTSAIRAVAEELEVPVLVCLEGGYSPAALAESVVATATALSNGRVADAVPAAAAEPHLSRLRERWEL